MERIELATDLWQHSIQRCVGALAAFDLFRIYMFAEEKHAPKKNKIYIYNNFIYIYSIYI